MLSVNDQFPAFCLNGINAENQHVTVSSNQLEGSWAVIYFYPKDFTFICPTEIAGMDKLMDEAIVLGISGDNEYCKLNWKLQNDIIGKIKHTLAGDTGLYLSGECGILDIDEGVCLRATFIVNPQGTIQHVSANALDTGRNAHEVLRTLQALKAGGLTGCEWNPGEEFVV